MKQLTGDELFSNEGMHLNFSISDFWKWYASNTLHSALRGAIAEFIVAKALDLPCAVRQSWDAYDLEYKGIKIEVKSSAYLQDDNGDNFSRISFSIAKHSHWNENEKWNNKVRHSNVYVFCLFSETDRDKADPLQIGQWQFYVLPTSVLDEQCGDRQTLSLSALLSLSPFQCTYSDLQATIDALHIN